MFTLPSLCRKAVPSLAMALLLGSGPVLAANILKEDDARRRYDNCLSLAGLDPAAALGVAGEWKRTAEGGAPSDHCAAVALVGLKRYKDAAGRLDVLARAPGMGNLRASLFSQAGNAWMLAGDAARAVASFQSALTLSASDPDLYADLARAQAMQKDWRSVEADLNAALAMAPRRPDLLVLRASARHALGNLKAARADTDAALKLKANFVEALVERGSIARDAGDASGARADFQAVLKLDGNGPSADAARRSLQALDAAGKPGPQKPAPPKSAPKKK